MQKRKQVIKNSKRQPKKRLRLILINVFFFPIFSNNGVTFIVRLSFLNKQSGRMETKKFYNNSNIRLANKRILVEKSLS